MVPVTAVMIDRPEATSFRTVGSLMCCALARCAGPAWFARKPRPSQLQQGPYLTLNAPLPYQQLVIATQADLST